MNSNIKPYLGKSSTTHLFLFTTPSPPSLSLLSLTNELLSTIDPLSLLNIPSSSINNLTLYTAHINLNRIYFLFTYINNSTLTFKCFIHDLSSKQSYPIILPDNTFNSITNHISLKHYTSLLEQNKIFFIGGLLQDNKHIQKSIITFDISTYTFKKEKFSEFTLCPRYKLGATSQNGILYVIGGYTSYPEDKNNITEEVQFGKYGFNELHKFNFSKIEHEKPHSHVDPEVLIIQDRYILSFSSDELPKLWIMDIEDNKGFNYDLREYGFDTCNNISQGIYVQLIDAVFPEDEKQTTLTLAITNTQVKSITVKYLIIKLKE
jgi:hypothetical protein